jgi:hypothetical protein
MKGRGFHMFESRQKSAIAILAIVLVGGFGLTAGASAAQPVGPGVQIVAKGSVDDVVGQLKKMVADSGMMVMGELHQGDVLSMTGLKVQSETLFVGNPTVGKELGSSCLSGSTSTPTLRVRRW